MTRVRLVAAIAVLGALGVGCSPKPTEFESSAERLLEEELAGDPGGTWTVTCAEPVDIEVDTTFSCTATDDQEQRTYTVRITSRSKYVVTADGEPTTTPVAAPTTVAAAPTSVG